MAARWRCRPRDLCPTRPAPAPGRDDLDPLAGGAGRPIFSRRRHCRGTEGPVRAQSEDERCRTILAPQYPMNPNRDTAARLLMDGRECRTPILLPALAPAAASPVSVENADLSLVRRVQAGERAAYDLLVLKYQHKVVKLVMRYVRNPADAEDIAQEAFIKAYRALPQFRGDSAFYTWLYRIAINSAKNAVVSRDRSPIDYDLDRNNPDESYDMQGRMKDSETPEGLVLTDEIRSTVNAAIDALPEDLRTAIVLRELEGLSYEGIAAAMDCPVGTVRSRIFRAREAIDRRLREVFEGGLGRAEELG